MNLDLTTLNDIQQKYLLDVMQNGIEIQTSGSSGIPKKIFQPPAKIYADALNAIETQGITRKSKVYTCLSLERAGGLFAQSIPALTIGAELTIEKLKRSFFCKSSNFFFHVF